MASTDHKTTRRQLLGAAITIPAIAVVGGATAFATAKASEAAFIDRAAWERALDTFQRADAAMNAYNRDHMSPASRAYEAVQGKLASSPAAKAVVAAYDRAQDGFDRLVDEQSDACEALMLTPAPDGAALVVKLDILIAHQVYEWSVRADLMAAIQQDARRLLSSGRA